MASTPDARPSTLNSEITGSVLGVTAESGPLYALAFTHRSHAFENGADEHNERLEFLGDAILGAVVTDLIYTRFPELAEGEMARLRASVVNTHALADIAASLGLGDSMLLGKGEEGSGGRAKHSLLANAFEAVIGALYLDKGIEEVTRRLAPIFTERVQASLDAESRYDAKTALQEVAVARAGELPVYRLAASGPDHDKRFVAHVYVDEKLCGMGTGRSKKEAEQKAATEALRLLGGSGDARAS